VFALGNLPPRHLNNKFLAGRFRLVLQFVEGLADFLVIQKGDGFLAENVHCDYADKRTTKLSPKPANGPFS